MKRFFFPIIIVFLIVFLFTTQGRQQTPSVIAQTSNTDWPQVQHDSQRTGHATSALVPPFNVKWKWLNGNKWNGQSIPNAYTVEIPILSQPIIGDGKVYVTSFQGTLYAISESTGDTVWSFPTGMPLLHSAGYKNSTVYFGGSDGYFYALNSSNGTLRWKYNTGPIDSAPLILSNKICIGSTTGFFYCFLPQDQDNNQIGDLVFKYATNAPIYQTAASSPDESKIYFGAEDMKPRCLQTNTTNQNGADCSGWNPYILPAESLMHYWPVAAGDKVIFTTFPQYESQYDIFGAVDRFFESLSSSAWQDVEPALINFYQTKPYFQTLFVLNGSTGQKAFNTAASHLGYHQDALVPPVIMSDGQAYFFYRGKVGSLGGSFGTNYPPDFGSMDLQNGKITPQVGDNYGVASHDLDDNSAFSAGGSVFYAIHNGGRCAAGLDLIQKKGFCAGNLTTYNIPPNTPFFFDTSEEGLTPDKAGYENRGEGFMGPSISGNSMYMVYRGGALFAITGVIR